MRGPFLTVFGFLFGLVVGSFCNVCIHRLPRRESIVMPPSHCPHCQALVRAVDNIPLISFLLLRRQCRNCGHRISWQYPVVEFLTGLLFLGVVWRFGVGLRPAIWAAFLAALIVVTFIDLEHMIVPDRITLPGIGIGLLAAWAWPPPELRSVAIGVLVGGGFFWAVGVASTFMLKKGRIEVNPDLRIVAMNQTAQALLGLGPDEVMGRPCVEAFGGESALFRVCQEAVVEGRTHAQVEVDLSLRDGSSVPVHLSSTIVRAPDGAVARTTLLLEREGLGGGDIKLAAMIGAFLGWQGVLVTILLGTLIGSLVAIVLLATGRKARQHPIPFGPFLALGAVLVLFWGEEILAWYWHLLRGSP
jgi:leader peptidase (prepilin peptidase)/N-methyltransferase